MLREAGEILQWGRAGYPLMWILLFSVVLGVFLVFLSGREYRLGRSRTAIIRLALRLGALAAILVWFAEPSLQQIWEKRHPSQVVILVDTSASMLFPDGHAGSQIRPTSVAEAEHSGASSNSSRQPGAPSRWESVLAFFAQGRIVEQLARSHEVTVFSFDEQDPQPIFSTAAGSAWRLEGPGETLAEGKQGSQQRSADRQNVNENSKSLKSRSEVGESSTGNGKLAEAELAARADGSTLPPAITASEIEARLRSCIPKGRETRLGDALSFVATTYPQENLAAIVVLSDGGHNAGGDITSAIERLTARQIPVFTAGFGAVTSPGDVRIAHVDFPSQVRPGDPFPVTVHLEAEGYRGKVRVELEARRRTSGAGSGNRSETEGQAVAKSTPPTEQIKQQVLTELTGEQKATPVRFELAFTVAGDYAIQLRLSPDPVDMVESNNRREVVCEVVDRPLKVLLLAGGPSREYQFLRNVLFRDQSVRVDILLQSALPGAWQEADRLLQELPKDLAILSEYDCLVALDPDWRQVAPSAAEVPKRLELVEHWIAELGAGMVFSAGAVYAGDSVSGWRNDPHCEAILRLLPVSLAEGERIVGPSFHTSSEPRPLELTPEGLAATFLWLAPGAEASERVWRSFPGVYSCLNVDQPKRGAAVLALYSDPRAGRPGKSPIYLAEHYYGAGRVLYLGSCELWRLRAVDERFYERLWLQLIRRAAEGRVLAGSRRILIAADGSAYRTGETVVFRARLVNKQNEAIQLESVTGTLIGPDGKAEQVVLRPVAEEPGHYRGSVLVYKVGDYRLVLQPKEAEGEEAQCRFRVELSSLEERTLVRNEALLRQLAAATGGRYFDNWQTPADPSGPDFLPKLITPRTWVETIVSPPTQPTLADLTRKLLSWFGAFNIQLPEPVAIILRLRLDWFFFGLAILLLAAEWLHRQLVRE